MVGILLGLSWAAAVQGKAPTEFHVRALTPASTVVLHRAGVMVASHGVEVRFTNAVLTADQATLDPSNTVVIATGHVTLQQEGHLWKGSRLEYNYRTREVRGNRFRTAKPPIYAEGDGLQFDLERRVYTATNAMLTTDDVSKPAYWVGTKRMVIAPGRYFKAYNALLYLDHVPVFYFPYYRRNLSVHPNQFTATPGYRSIYGPYLLGAYDWYWDRRLSGTMHLDYRAKRGVGAGPDFGFNYGKWSEGVFRGYYTHDWKPGMDSLGRPIDPKRYRIYFADRVEPWTNFTTRVMVRKQSDAQVIRDFFEGEYRKNTQPNSFLDADQLWPNFSLDLIAQPQVNDFFETVERLPEAQLSAFRQELGYSPLYYESQSSLGYLRRRFVDGSQPDYAAWRADTFHQILWPQTYFGWLRVVPRVGGRFTHYSASEGAGTTLSSADRYVFNTGVEVSTKASRVWPGVRNKALELDGLRHIVEPSVNYAFVPTPNRRPLELPQFDSELPSFQLLPLEFPQYNSIDSIDSENVLRFGLQNKLQTHRHGGVANVLNWSLFTDWRLKPRTGQSTFSDVYSELDFLPRSWLVLSSETRFDIQNRRFRIAYHSVTLQPGSRWSWSLGHLYVRNGDPEFGVGNNLITSRIYYRFNENWAVRFTHHFEARDGTMEEQYYTVYRDFRSWTGALTLRLRDNRNGKSDVTVGFTFSLKAFPRFKLGSDRETPSLLLGG